jgi:hypothetical protein
LELLQHKYVDEEGGHLVSHRADHQANTPKVRRHRDLHGLNQDRQVIIRAFNY